MDQPRKTIQRFASTVSSIVIHMSIIRNLALAAAKDEDDPPEWKLQGFKVNSKASSERIIVLRQEIDDLARDVVAHIIAPPNQTGAQWVLGVLELADGACSFASDTDSYYVLCDSGTNEDPFSSYSIFNEETVETVCQHHDFERIQRGLEDASRYANRAAVLARPEKGETMAWDKFVKVFQEINTPENRKALAEAIGKDSELASRFLPFPISIEDFKHLARIVEIPEGKIGDMTASEIVDCALAWADRQRIKARLTADGKNEGNGVGVVVDKCGGNGLPKEPMTRPSDKAFQAWQIRELLNISDQTEIANKMVINGVKATQGQVSKWLKAVDGWRKGGGEIPQVGTLGDKPQSVAPDVLEMGARQDGRTARQRGRRDPDADSYLE
jgi:hypothetical protein